MKMQTLTLRSQNAILAVASTAMEVRDHAYALVMRSPLAPTIRRINAFFEDNSTLLFWGGAVFFFCTHPPLFVASFGTGLVAASMMLHGGGPWRRIDFTATRQMGKCVSFVLSNYVSMQTRCLIAGFNPGYHTYNLIQGLCYGGGMKGFEALKHEVDRACWELAQWLPLLDVAKHPRLFASPPLPK